MGKVYFLIIVLLLAACAPLPTPATVTPIPDLAEKRHNKLTMVEFFGVT
jgi:uncharacterized lipoprotein YajG